MTSVFLSRRFLICFAANLLQATGFGLFLQFPGFLQQLGASTTVIGGAASLMSLAAIAVSPALGRFLDLTGRRRVILTASAGNIAVCAGFVFVHALVPAIALRFVHSALETTLHVAFFTYALDLVPAARRSQGLALFGVSAMAAMGLGGVAGDLAFAADGYRGVFLGAIVLSLAAAVAALTLGESRPDPEPAAGAKRNWTAVLTQRPLWGVWALTAAFFFAMSSVFVYMKTWVLQTGLGSVGLYFAVYAGTAITLRVLLGWVPDRLGAARMAAPTLLAYAGGLFMLASTDNVTMFVMAAVLGGLGHGYGYPVLLTLVTARVGNTDRGTGVAVYNAIDAGAGLIGAPVLGFVIDRWGYSPMFVVAGGLVTAAVILCGRALRGGRFHSTVSARF